MHVEMSRLPEELVYHSGKKKTIFFCGEYRKRRKIQSGKIISSFCWQPG